MRSYSYLCIKNYWLYVTVILYTNTNILKLYKLFKIVSNTQHNICLRLYNFLSSYKIIKYRQYLGIYLTTVVTQLILVLFLAICDSYKSNDKITRAYYLQVHNNKLGNSYIFFYSFYDPQEQFRTLQITLNHCIICINMVDRYRETICMQITTVTCTRPWFISYINKIFIV